MTGGRQLNEPGVGHLICQNDPKYCTLLKVSYKLFLGITYPYGSAIRLRLGEAQFLPMPTGIIENL